MPVASIGKVMTGDHCRKKAWFLVQANLGTSTLGLDWEIHEMFPIQFGIRPHKIESMFWFQFFFRFVCANAKTRLWYFHPKCNCHSRSFHIFESVRVCSFLYWEMSNLQLLRWESFIQAPYNFYFFCLPWQICALHGLYLQPGHVNAVINHDYNGLCIV